MASSILDQYGRPYSRGKNLYPSPSTHRGDNRPKPLVKEKIYENQTTFSRTEQVNYSRVLATQCPGIDAALEMKAKYSIGDAWHIGYMGQNQSWGDRMESLFNESYNRNCNQIGEAHDWHSTLRTLCRALDTDADYGIWFDSVDTKDPVTGKTRRATGQFQVLDYSRFGTGDDDVVSLGNGIEQCNELGAAEALKYRNTRSRNDQPYYIINDPASQFDGQRIIDGMIYDQNLRLLGRRILGYNSRGERTYVDVHKEAVHFNYEVGTWINQTRGIPSLANLLDDANSVSDIIYYWKQGVQLASQKMVWRESPDGRPGGGVQETEVDTGVADPKFTDGTTIKKLVAIEDAPAGLVELSTRNGEKLGTLDLNRPSMEEREFVKLVETAYFHKHWPRCLIYSEDSARAGSRSIAQQVQVLLRGRQMTLERSARFIADRKIAHAMANGELPENNNLFDAYNYNFSVPATYTIDEGNDAKMQLSMLGRCAITRGHISNEMGFQFKNVLKTNAKEVDAIALAAEEIVKKHPEMTFADAMNRLDNNGNVNVQPETAATEPNMETK